MQQKKSVINKNRKPKTIAIYQEKISQRHLLIRTEPMKQSRRTQTLESDEPGFQWRMCYLIVTSDRTGDFTNGDTWVISYYNHFLLLL